MLSMQNLYNICDNFGLFLVKMAVEFFVILNAFFGILHHFVID